MAGRASLFLSGAVCAVLALKRKQRWMKTHHKYFPKVLTTLPYLLQSSSHKSTTSNWQPWNGYCFKLCFLRNDWTIGHFQYLQFFGSSNAIEKCGPSISSMSFCKDLKSCVNSFCCCSIRSAPISVIALMFPHGLPPTHGKEAYNKNSR